MGLPSSRGGNGVRLPLTWAKSSLLLLPCCRPLPCSLAGNLCEREPEGGPSPRPMQVRAVRAGKAVQALEAGQGCCTLQVQARCMMHRPYSRLGHYQSVSPTWSRCPRFSLACFVAALAVHSEIALIRNARNGWHVCRPWKSSGRPMAADDRLRALFSPGRFIMIAQGQKSKGSGPTVTLSGRLVSRSSDVQRLLNRLH